VPVRLGCPQLRTKPIHKHITAVRGVHYFGAETPYAKISRQLGCPLWTKNTKEKNTNKEEYNNDNRAEKPITVEVRLERRQEKTCYKKTRWAK